MREFDLVEFCRGHLSDLRDKGLIRDSNVTNMTDHTNGSIQMAGYGPHRASFFASNDYLGLSRHPRVVAAAAGAAFTDGAGAGASRSVTGTSQAVIDLEASLARLKQTEGALVYTSGFHANHGVITSLVGRNDVVLCDRLAHTSIIHAVKASGASLIRFSHNDCADLDRRLSGVQAEARPDSRLIIATEGLFSMDGDIAPLPEIMDLAANYGAAVLIDDAHATGVIGTRGGGSLSFYDLHTHPLVRAGNVVQVGTLSKALGSLGGFVAGPLPLIEFLRSRSASFIYTTALPPSAVAAAVAAVEIAISDEGDGLRARLQKNLTQMRTAVSAGGHVVLGDKASPIVPVVIGDSEATMTAMRRLLDHGVFAPGIRPPTIPGGSSRIRLTISAHHTAEDIERVRRILNRDESPLIADDHQTPRRTADYPRTLTVLGTDTGVGKTFVTCGLIRLLRESGVACDAVKPIETGYQAGPGTDAFEIAQALGHHDPSRVSEYAFPDPISPHLAFARSAEVNGERFDKERVVKQIRSRSNAAFTIIETAGGVLSPITHEYSMAELARDIGGPCILVTDPYLGTFSRTLSALEVARSRGLLIEAIVVSDSRSEPFDPATLEELGVLTGLPCVLVQQDVDTARSLEAIIHIVLPMGDREVVGGRA